MEKNFISESQKTYFYVDLVNKTYGVYINIKDLVRKDEIINKMRESNKETIEAWKKEWCVNQIESSKARPCYWYY